MIHRDDPPDFLNQQSTQFNFLFFSRLLENCPPPLRVFTISLRKGEDMDVRAEFKRLPPSQPTMFLSLNFFSGKKTMEGNRKGRVRMMGTGFWICSSACKV